MREVASCSRTFPQPTRVRCSSGTAVLSMRRRKQTSELDHLAVGSVPIVGVMGVLEQFVDNAVAVLRADHVIQVAQRLVDAEPPFRRIKRVLQLRNRKRLESIGRRLGHRHGLGYGMLNTVQMHFPPKLRQARPACASYAG